MDRGPYDVEKQQYRGLGREPALPAPNDGMIIDMRLFGSFHGAARAAALSAAILSITCAAQAAVPEAASPKSVTGEYRAVVDRLVRLEREVNDLQRATYSRLAARRTNPQSAADSAYAPRPAGLDQRLSDLEAALRSLTGRLERVEYEMRQLKTRMDRLAASAGQTGLTPPEAGSPSRPAAGSQTTEMSGAGAPRNLAATRPGQGAMPSPQQGSMDRASQPEGTEPAGAADTASGKVQPANGRPEPSQGQSNSPELSGDEGRDFNRARDLLLRGEFARAGDMFGAIARRYPKSKLAGDSQFWKAESLFVRELYKDAAEAYLVVARDFPDSAKAPDSLVKLSLSFDKLGERKQACAALAQLDRRYPKAPERVRQNAERIKKQFSCG